MYACVGVGLVYAHIKKTHGDARSLQAVIQCDLSEINVYPLNNITHLCTVLSSNKRIIKLTSDAGNLRVPFDTQKDTAQIRKCFRILDKIMSV